ncbi:MAG: hypothetical protein ACJ75J_14290, partial [Cytophagaceae bacterium]
MAYISKHFLCELKNIGIKKTSIFKSIFSPAVSSKQDRVTYWRERIYYSLAMALCIFGFIAYVPSVYLSVKEDLWSVAILDTLVLAGIVSIFIFKKIPYMIRVSALLVILYLLGVALLLLLGPNGAGLIWLFAFPILTSILAGLGPAIIAIAINAISVTTLGLLNFFHLLDKTLMSGYYIESWSIISVNFICLNLLTSIPIAML